MRTKRKLAAGVVGGICLMPLAAIGQFIGLGPTITFDPTVAAHIISQTAEVVRIGATGLQTYNQLRADAQFATSKTFWSGFPFMIVNSSMMSPSAPTDAWARAVTRGLNTTTAYANNSMVLRSNPSVIFNSQFAAHYASAQIGQSATVAAMQTLGNVRTQQTLMQRPIANCQQTALSIDPLWNSRGAQMNVSTACQSLLLQQSQAQLGVDASRLELETARLKIQTDGMIEYANMVGNAQAIQVSQPIAPGSVGASMQAYRPH